MTDSQKQRPTRNGSEPKTSRRSDGSSNWTTLTKPNPNKRYVWAYEGSSETGAEYYRDLGFDEERAGSPDDPLPGGRRRVVEKGQIYRSHGHVLMSISKDEHDDIVEFGEDGVTGRQLTRQYAKRIKQNQLSSGDQQHLAANHLMVDKQYKF